MRDTITFVLIVTGMASFWLASPVSIVLAAYWWGGASLPAGVAVWSAVKTFMAMIGTGVFALFLAFLVADSNNVKFNVKRKTLH